MAAVQGVVQGEEVGEHVVDGEDAIAIMTLVQA